MLSGMSTVAAAAAGVGIALGRAPLIDEELASGRLVPLVPQLRMAGSWGYVMRIQPNRPMDASLPALRSFLLEKAKAGALRCRRNELISRSPRPCGYRARFCQGA